MEGRGAGRPSYSSTLRPKLKENNTEPDYAPPETRMPQQLGLAGIFVLRAARARVARELPRFDLRTGHRFSQIPLQAGWSA